MTWHSTTFCRVDKRRTHGTSQSLFVKAHKESQAVYESSQCVHAVHGPRGLSNINQLLFFFSCPRASQLSPLHFGAKLTQSDPGSLPSSLDKGFNKVQQELLRHIPFPFLSYFHTIFCLPHLSLCFDITFFFAPMTLHPSL